MAASAFNVTIQVSNPRLPGIQVLFRFLPPGLGVSFNAQHLHAGSVPLAPLSPLRVQKVSILRALQAN